MFQSEESQSFQTEPQGVFHSEEPAISLHPERPGEWKPFVETLGEALAPQFEWKAETGTIQTYEHRETFRYIHIDSETNSFLDQQCNVITKKAALAHALQAIREVAPQDAPDRSAEAFFETGTEPLDLEDLELNAFTRPVPAESRRTAWDLGGKFDAAASGQWTARIRSALDAARGAILQNRHSDSDTYSGHAALVQAGGTREFQDASLTKFMRRGA